jgi:hypothetical protein
MKKPYFLIRLLILVVLIQTGLARPLDDLPGEEVVLPEARQSLAPASQPKTKGNSATWLAPPLDEQLSRDPTLLTVSQGALFVPTFSESRREPEIGIYSRTGRFLKRGLTGTRTLLDSGDYEMRLGSGSQLQQLRFPVHIEEGHTQVIQPTWGGILVETLTQLGEYIEGQYEVIRMDREGWYGRGRGLGEERLQDIKVWLLPPGIYRLGKVGEPVSSLVNYITVEVHAGELQTLELIFADKTNGSIIAGGLKSLTARTSVGRNWTFGMRAGGNLAFVRNVDLSGTHKESSLFASDVRLRVRYDQPVFFGLNEISVRDNFLKEKGLPISVVADEAQARTTWVRRINAWVGPYVRAQASTHFFPRHATEKVVQLGYLGHDTSNAVGHDSGRVVFDTLQTDSSGSFRYEPSFYPLQLSQGLGVNLDLLNFSMIELTTQVGLAAKQKYSRDEYIPYSSTQFYRTVSENNIGLETLVNARIRLFSMITLDTRTELFAPNAKLAEIQLSDLEIDLRLSLNRFVELGYLYQVTELTEAAANRFPSSHNLSLRFNLNY